MALYRILFYSQRKKFSRILLDRIEKLILYYVIPYFFQKSLFILSFKRISLIRSASTLLQPFFSFNNNELPSTILLLICTLKGSNIFVTAALSCHWREDIIFCRGERKKKYSCRFLFLFHNIKALSVYWHSSPLSH